MITAPEALESLMEGNRRFQSSQQSHHAHRTSYRRVELTTGQAPFAVVVGCSDSRVPPELIFDQGLGDLFVIRVAGNIVTPPLAGSVEYAAAHLGTGLVVVMGHSKCGAVLATIEELKNPSGSLSPNVQSLIDPIRPSVEPFLATSDQDTLVREAIRANVRASANHLRNESQTLKDLIASGNLLVVGAEYSLETGAVDFFDGTPH